MRTDIRPALRKGMDDRVLACAQVERWTEVRGGSGDEGGTGPKSMEEMRQGPHPRRRAEAQIR